MLVRELTAPLNAYAVSRTNRADAEDLVAQTFAVMWSKWDSLPRGRVRRQSWAFETLKRTIKDYHATRYRRAGLEQRVASSLPREDAGSDIQDAVVEKDFLERVLEKMPQDMVEVTELTDKGYKAREIAELLGVTTTVVTTRQSRARRLAREVRSTMEGETK